MNNLPAITLVALHLSHDWVLRKSHATTLDNATQHEESFLACSISSQARYPANSMSTHVEAVYSSSSVTQLEACCSDVKSKASSTKNHKGRRQMDDDFMVRLYKIKMCTRTTPHNWKLCSWAHPGETAAIRRDPSTHMAEMCPAVRQHQECPHGEGCLYARNTFECWLHPYRYRTTMCSSGEACTRNICFFAHNVQELRAPPDVTQQWAMPGAAAGMVDPQPLANLSPAQAQQLANGALCAMGALPAAATASGPLAGLMAGVGTVGEGACALSPASSHSSPMPVTSLGALWCAMAPPGCSTPAVLASPHAQQLQLQQMLMQQQMQPGGFTSPQALAATAPLPGVFYSPMAAGADLSVSQAAVLGSAASPTVLCAVNQQQEMMRPSYSISVTAGMYPARAPSSNGLISLTSAVPSPGNSAAKLQALQPMAAEQAALQQAAAMQHAALLLQQLQLSGAMGAGSSRLSTDSLQSSLLLGSGSTLPPLSQLSLSDFSNDNLSALMPNSYPITQDLGMRSNSGMLLGGVGVTSDTSLLPLESCGLIQLSAMDEPPVLLDQNSQRQQQVTMAMQQAGRYW